MKSNLPIKLIVSAVCIAGAAIHLGWPALQIDSITVVLLIVAVLPWAQPLIKSIELLGVKVDLQELEKEVKEAKGAAQNATRQAELARATSEASIETSSSRGVVQEVNIDALTEEYNQIRLNQSPSDSRTIDMTRVVSKMMEAARRLQNYDVARALQDPNGGKRLFGYVYLHEKPSGQFLLPLVDSVVNIEEKPFGQYWGLQSIGRVLPSATAGPLREAKNKLLAFAERIQPGTDRDHELRRLLKQIDESNLRG